jgi:hypothetical protein
MYNERSLFHHYIFRIPWLLLGLALGLHFPDIDSRFQLSGVLLHRSILTHGLLLSLLLFWLIKRRRDTRPSLRLFVIGVNLAVAVHLCFDFFPHAWIGFALIHIPLYGWTSPLFSQTWIILSMVVCLCLAFVLARNFAEFLLSIVILIISFGISAGENRGSNIQVLVFLVVSTTMALLMAYWRCIVKTWRA